MEGTVAYEVFLSYRTSDRDRVVAFRDALMRHGVPSFLDHESLVAGLPWPRALEAALSAARAVLVFIGAAENGHSLGEWQQREVAFALDRQSNSGRDNRAFAVIPVLLPGSRPETSFLFQNTWIDLRHSVENDRAVLAVVRALSPGAEPIATEAVGIVCPYRALEAFHEEHAALFFGRESFADALLERVTTREFVALVGASGSGKSSVMQAGLFPKLRRRRPPDDAWDLVCFRPGAEPFSRLALALAPLLEPGAAEIERLELGTKLGTKLAEGSIDLADVVDRILAKSNGTDRLLIAIDQFEELFALARQELRPRFVSMLLDTLGRAKVTVMLTLRADFYGHAIGFDRRLSEYIQSGIVNIGPLDRGELMRTMTEPAARVGLSFESGLVDRVLDHLESQPGSLPLLQFALTQLWERRAGSEITHASYRAIGEVEGALSVSAGRILNGLSEPEKQVAKSLFTRLVRVAGAGDRLPDARGRVQVDALSTGEYAILRPFVEARLLVIGATGASEPQCVEVAHEALIHSWPQLSAWISAEREFLVWRQGLGARISEWEQGEREKDLLLRGSSLKAASKWVTERKSALNEKETEFVAKSRKMVRRGKIRLRAAIAVVCAPFLLLAAWTALRQANWFLAWAGPFAATTQGTTNGGVAYANLMYVLDSAHRLNRLDSRTLELWGGHDDHWGAFWWAARVLAYSGRTSEANHFADRAMSIRKKVTDWETPRMLIWTTDCLVEVGRVEEARTMANEALALTRKEASQTSRAMGLANAAQALAAAGLAAEAEAAIAEAKATFSSDAPMATRTSFEGQVAFVLARLDHAGEVRRLLIEHAAWGVPLPVIQALVDKGHLEEARDVASGTANPFATALVASALFERGDADARRTTAEALALLAKQPLGLMQRHFLLRFLQLELLLKVETPAEAVRAVRERDDLDELVTLTQALALHLDTAAACALARDVATRLGAAPSTTREWEVAKLVGTLGRCDSPQAVSSLVHGIRDADMRLYASANAASGFAEAGHREEAIALIDEVDKGLTSMNSSELRIQAWSLKTDANVRLHRYGKVSFTEMRANDITIDVKISVWTRMLAEEAATREPELRLTFARGFTKGLGRYGLHWW